MAASIDHCILKRMTRSNNESLNKNQSMVTLIESLVETTSLFQRLLVNSMFNIIDVRHGQSIVFIGQIDLPFQTSNRFRCHLMMQVIQRFHCVA
jgi:hypothetical protein